MGGSQTFFALHLPRLQPSLVGVVALMGHVFFLSRRWLRRALLFLTDHTRYTKSVIPKKLAAEGTENTTVSPHVSGT